MQLRNYQQSALEAINKAYQKGITRQVAVLATGLGKTIIFSQLIADRVASTHKKALILAHREELLFQAKEKLERVNPDLKIGIEQAEKTADHTRDDVVIASVASIGRENSPRLQQFRPQEYGTIIIDEAHHASANSYKTILRHFGVLKAEQPANKEILLLGVTATPNRNDNQGIDQVFDEVIFDYSISEGIRNGWLSRIKAFKINTAVTIEQVKTTAGDFAIGELEKAINTEERNNLIVQMYKDLAAGRQVLLFAADVAHTKDVFDAFTRSHISAGFITGETPKEQRKELLAAFATRKIHVMVNTMVLTEGYDNAGIEYIFMARPTQSGLLYQQMIGRGTRIHQDKNHLTIVDFVDNTTTHPLKTAASLLGLDGAIDFQGSDIMDMKNNIDELLEKRPYINLNQLKVQNIDYLIKEIDILQEKELAKKEEHYTWHKFGDGMRMHNGTTRYFFVEQSLTGQYVLYEFLRVIHKKKIIAEFDSQSQAMRYADGQIVQSFGQGSSGTFGKTSIPMTSGIYGSNDMPSEAQMSLLRELGVDEQTILFLNKREASLLISERKRRK